VQCLDDTDHTDDEWIDLAKLKNFIDNWSDPYNFNIDYEVIDPGLREERDLATRYVYEEVGIDLGLYARSRVDNPLNDRFLAENSVYYPDQMWQWAMYRGFNNQQSPVFLIFVEELRLDVIIGPIMNLTILTH